MVASTGPFAPFVFMFLYILACIFFLPGAVFSISSGVLFGTILGTVYTVVGASIGAVLAFLIARYFARSFFEYTVEKKFKNIREFDEKLEKNGFITVLFLRLIPLFPFNGLNFALGITKVRLKDYFLATLIGIIPGSFLFAYLGDSIIEMSYLNIVIAVILIVLLSLTLTFYNRYKKKKSK
tara:strand:- start:2055 stop:2597 length:543 start_codon:yes stop_codon:yes gene_type:complete